MDRDINRLIDKVWHRYPIYFTIFFFSRRIATLVKNDSNPGPHWLPEPGVIFGQYKTYEECQHVVDEMVSSENVESQALAMLRQCDKEQKRKARTMETNAEETAKEKTAVRPTEKDVSNGEN